jgi:probable rRNA maturation factor
MSDDPSPGGHTTSPSPAVLVSDRYEGPATVDVDGLVELARRTLLAEGLAEGELSLSFVDEAEIEDLHVRYLHEPGPTDVLSFPLDGEDERGVRVLGDVVIAPAVAARNNPDDPAAELRLLVVHGVLHLLGYDHEEEDEKAQMWARQLAYSGVDTP